MLTVHLQVTADSLLRSLQLLLRLSPAAAWDLAQPIAAEVCGSQTFRIDHSYAPQETVMWIYELCRLLTEALTV